MGSLDRWTAGGATAILSALLFWSGEAHAYLTRATCEPLVEESICTAEPDHVLPRRPVDSPANVEEGFNQRTISEGASREITYSCHAYFQDAANFRWRAADADGAATDTGFCGAWRAGSFRTTSTGACSASCGGGTQTVRQSRRVYCNQPGFGEVSGSDRLGKAVCDPSSRPSSTRTLTRSCNTQACPPPPPPPPPPEDPEDPGPGGRESVTVTYQATFEQFQSCQGGARVYRSFGFPSELVERLDAGSGWSGPNPFFDDAWSEQLYLARNSDVRGLIDAGIYASGWEHWLAEGWGQGRTGGWETAARAAFQGRMIRDSGTLTCPSGFQAGPIQFDGPFAPGVTGICGYPNNPTGPRDGGGAEPGLNNWQWSRACEPAE